MNIIEHSAYVTCRKHLKAALDNFMPGHMVFLIGPSGVGKTTLRHSVMQEMFGNPLHWGRGRIPAIEVFAKLPNRAYFSSRELAISLLDELNVPSLNWFFAQNNVDKSVEKRIKDEISECGDVWAMLRPKMATEGDYWRAFQLTLSARSCKYVSIDQANALLVNRSDTSPSDHTLHLMSLAESAGVMFIMTGIHTVTKLWAIHSELRRRVIPVWMPPYSDRRKEDETHYLRLLKTLSSKYELSKCDLLCTMAHDIMAATGGIFAEIIQLLNRAREKVFGEGGEYIRKKDIEDSYYNNTDMATLWQDIEAFEESMAAGDVSQRAALTAARWRRKEES